MTPSSSPPLSGRRAQAAKNDRLILESARAVFLADPGAPIAAVAEHAGVGISALYRRYRSKEELLQRLASDGLSRYIAETEAALADEGDPWEAFAGFMRRCLDAGASSLTSRLAGNFAATDELRRQGMTAYEATRRLLDRTKAAGALRPDIEVGDIHLLFEQLQAVDLGDADRTRRIRQRYLALILHSLHAAQAPPLPGPAPTWQEIGGRWDDRAG